MTSSHTSLHATVSVWAYADLLSAATELRLISAIEAQQRKPDDGIERVTEKDYLDLWQCITSSSPEQPLGISIGARINPEAKGLLASWVSQCTDLREALTTFIKHIALMNPAESWQVWEEGDAVRLVYRISTPYPIQAAERAMASMLAWARHLSGSSVNPLAVGFSTTREDHKPVYQAFFHAPVKFNEPEHYLLISGETLDKPVASANRLMKGIIADKARQALAALTPSTSGHHSPIRLRVQQIIEDALPHGQPDITLVCRNLNCSRQTLYRKLKAENTTFTDLLDECRKLKARHLLKQSLPITTVALELGYQDISSFFKAYHRWYGCTPAAHRDK